MTKEELLKQLKKAIGLAEKLDEPKKIVIPKFVADWIKKAKIYYGDEVSLMGIVYWIRNHGADTESHYEWLQDAKNQKLLLNAIANGYEVEKEKKHYVKICDGYSGYLNIDNFTSNMSVANMSEDNRFKTKFTDKEIKQLKQRDDIPLDWNKVTFEKTEG